jgi:hypothetical protein
MHCVWGCRIFHNGVPLSLSSVCDHCFDGFPLLFALHKPFWVACCKVDWPVFHITESGSKCSCIKDEGMLNSYWLFFIQPISANWAVRSRHCSLKSACQSNMTEYVFAAARALRFESVWIALTARSDWFSSLVDSIVVGERAIKCKWSCGCD